MWVKFCLNFPLFWLIFCYPDPYPYPFNETVPDLGGRNETDPFESGSKTLKCLKQKIVANTYTLNFIILKALFSLYQSISFVVLLQTTIT